MQNGLNNKVFLLLGTNLGNRSQNLLVARQHLEITVGKIIQESSIYETAAWGNTAQQSFLNQVVSIETMMAPIELLDGVLSIEAQMGRVREIKWGPRVIDIDILFFGDIIVASETLTIPHPALHERRFTLVPMAEIAGDFIHPVLQKNTLELLRVCSDPLRVTKVSL